MKNKHLTEYLRDRGNELAAVRFSTICGTMLSNNSFLCKSITILGKDNICYRIFISHLCKLFIWKEIIS